jgi:hypothetical protein
MYGEMNWIDWLRTTSQHWRTFVASVMMNLRIPTAEAEGCMNRQFHGGHEVSSCPWATEKDIDIQESYHQTSSPKQALHCSLKSRTRNHTRGKQISFQHVITADIGWDFWGFSQSLHAKAGSIAMGYELDDRGFESRQVVKIHLFTTASRSTLGPIQPPIQSVPGTLSLGAKRPGREADHSPPSSAEVKNAWCFTSTPPIRLQGVVFSWKAQEQLYLHLSSSSNLTTHFQLHRFM